MRSYQFRGLHNLYSNIKMSLQIRPLWANLTRDTEIFSNMDPYVTLTLGIQKRRSRTHQEGGKKPKWSDVFYFNPSAGNILAISVYDEDLVNDDLVGSANLDIKKFLSSPEQTRQTIQLQYKGKASGTITMAIKFTGNSSNGNNLNPYGTAQDIGGWGQQLGNNSWGQPSNGGWGQPSNGGWGQPSNGGWGQNNTGGAWGNQAGWPQPAPNGSQGGWSSGTGYANNSTSWQPQPSNPANNGWGPNAPVQGQPPNPNPLNLLNQLLQGPSKPTTPPPNPLEMVGQILRQNPGQQNSNPYSNGWN